MRWEWARYHKRKMDCLTFCKVLLRAGIISYAYFTNWFSLCSGSRTAPIHRHAQPPRKEITRSCPVYTAFSGATGGPDLFNCGEVLHLYSPAGLFASLTSMSHFRSQLFLPPGVLALLLISSSLSLGWLISLIPLTQVLSPEPNWSRKAQLSSQRHCSPQLWVRTQAF